jgi:integrase
MLPNDNPRRPYPLSWEEQERLIAELPRHLADMALFKVNTGTRKSEVCELRWEWEYQYPELKTSVFVIPAAVVKNKQDRLVVLNDIARQVVESRRGKHVTHVFTYKGEPVRRMLNSAWRKARVRAGLPTLRVHDLKHTFGRRLRAAGVSFEDRQDLLGHKSGRMTTHYSAAEIGDLIDAANRVVRSRKTPVLTILNFARERVST